jgi:glucose/arabinose dehydrogenase
MYRAAAAIALLSSLTLCAQNRSVGSADASAQDQPQTSTTLLVLAGNSAPVCPIGMEARQGVWDHTIAVHQGGEQYRGPFGQRILLALTDTHRAKIVAATVLVRGFDGKNRMLQTASSEGTATKVLRTGFTESSNNAVSADLYISGFTAVTSVKLLDVTYSDGTTWQADRTNSCRVAPDPMMLVAAH